MTLSLAPFSPLHHYAVPVYGVSRLTYFNIWRGGPPARLTNRPTHLASVRLPDGPVRPWSPTCDVVLSAGAGGIQRDAAVSVADGSSQSVQSAHRGGRHVWFWPSTSCLHRLLILHPSAPPHTFPYHRFKSKLSVGDLYSSTIWASTSRCAPAHATLDRRPSHCCACDDRSALPHLWLGTHCHLLC